MEDRVLKVSAGRRTSSRTSGWLMVLLLWAPSCVGRATLFTVVPGAGTRGTRSFLDTGATRTDSGHSDGGVTGTDGRNAGGAGMGPAGTSGGALRLDGIDDYVALSAGPGGASERAFSSELWFRTTAPTGMLLEVYASRGGVDDGGADRQSYLKNGQVCFYVFTSECNADRALCSILADATGAGNQGRLVGFLFTPSPWIVSGAF